MAGELEKARGVAVANSMQEEQGVQAFDGVRPYKRAARMRSVAQASVVLASALLLLWTALFVRSYRIVGSSMEPTLEDGDTVAAMKVVPRLAPLYRLEGRIVIAEVDGLEVVKRVVAERGGMLYLKGDNEDGSIDSRTYGWVPTSAVKWVVVCHR